jgi:NAD(P)-dependent dehydrogenase (short-subunit alcohol dehydrogenase family)
MKSASETPPTTEFWCKAKRTHFDGKQLGGETSMSQLNGQVALVTGGSRGIGAAIAKHLAKAGADVAITYVSSPDKANAVVDEIKAGGRRGVAIQADSADAKAMTAAVDKAAAELGRLDILVNNAGIFTPGAFEEVPVAELDRIWNVNVRAPIVAMQAAVKHMQNGGRLITIGSCLGQRVSSPGITIYSMTKGAVSNLARGLARDLGPRGITVNVVEPGPIDTDMNPASGEGAADQAKSTALGHYGKPDDIAAMVTHLAGEGGRYVTGASILVDGGYAA